MTEVITEVSNCSTRYVIVTERFKTKLIRKKVNLNVIQFDFVSGRITTDIFVPGRSTTDIPGKTTAGEHLAKNKHLYLAFVDMEEIFDWLPHCLISWSMQKLGLDEWWVRAIQAMYRDAFSSEYIKEFKYQ